MTVYLVTVRPGAESRRYFDSIWIVKKHAEERQAQLRDELKRTGYRVRSPGEPLLDHYWGVTLTEAQATDGQIADAPKDAA